MHSWWLFDGSPICVWTMHGKPGGMFNRPYLIPASYRNAWPVHCTRMNWSRKPGSHTNRKAKMCVENLYIVATCIHTVRDTWNWKANLPIFLEYMYMWLCSLQESNCWVICTQIYPMKSIPFCFDCTNLGFVISEARDFCFVLRMYFLDYTFLISVLYISKLQTKCRALFSPLNSHLHPFSIVWTA